MVSKQKAFTFLEIFLVVVVIGILATMTFPRMFRKKPAEKWETIVSELNNLVYYARQEAIAQNKPYRLHIYESEETYIAQVEHKGYDPDKDKRAFIPVRSYYFNPVYTFPTHVVIEAVYQGKEEQLDEHNRHAFIYIIPNGLVQETIIHLTKKEERSKVTFKMSPFFGTFELFKGFVKPTI